VLLRASPQRREAAELRSAARNYASAVRVELARRDCRDPVRQLELAAYFTHMSAHFTPPSPLLSHLPSPLPAERSEEVWEGASGA